MTCGAAPLGNSLYMRSSIGSGFSSGSTSTGAWPRPESSAIMKRAALIP